MNLRPVAKRTRPAPPSASTKRRRREACTRASAKVRAAPATVPAQAGGRRVGPSGERGTIGGGRGTQGAL